MYVRDWMSSPAFTAAPDSSAASALALMTTRGIRRLPVVDGERLVGIVTKTELAKHFGEGIPARRRMKTALSEFMTRGPITVAPEDTIESAARILLRKKYSGLPVVEDSRVVGVITESDLFRAIGRMLGINGRGARIQVVLPNDRAIVAFLANQLKNLELRNLVALPHPMDGAWSLVLRVRGRAKAKPLEAEVSS
jgi:acetoin utilization protein AcuB